MNTPIIFRLLSMVLFALAGAFLLSGGVGLVSGESWADRSIHAFGYASLIALASGGLFHLRARGGSRKIFRREALCAIGLSWLLSGLVGALPYYLALPGCSPVDAIFECTSGLTTTGATAFPNFDQFPNSLLFWRSISQWIGGLGVVVLFVALLSSLGAGAKILFSNESSGASTDFEHGRVQQGAFQLMLFYIGLTVACATAYSLCGLNGFEAICHALTTVATGGFSTHAQSIEGFSNPALEWCAVLFMALSGTTFVFVIRLLRRRFHTLRQNNEVYWYFAILVVSTMLLTALILRQGNADGILAALRAAAFQASSIMTTTGFSSTDFNTWQTPAHVILLILMAIGGCSGSTGGGLKVIRIVVAVRVVIRSVHSAFRPNIVKPLNMSGRTLRDSDISGVITFLCLNVALIGFGTLLVAVLQPGLDFESVFASVFATLFNIGPGLGAVGPTENFAFFGNASKLFFALLMILGRLELYAILVLFVPSVWKRYA